MKFLAIMRKIFANKERNTAMATIIAKLQSQTATKPHRHSHLPMPTEEEMEEIIDFISDFIQENENNSQLLQKMEEAIPPHIDKALMAFMKPRTYELIAEAEKVMQLVKQKLTPQQWEEADL